MLQFSSLVQLFFSSYHFTLPLLSQYSLLTTIITTFSSWDHLLSLYKLSNPYTVFCATTRQEILFSLLLVMDDYSSNQFSHISYVFHLFIDYSYTFHDFPFPYSATSSILFFTIPWLTQQVDPIIYKALHMYLVLHS